MRATDGRSQRCEYCLAMVRRPGRKQTPTLAETMTKHLESCPGKNR